MAGKMPGYNPGSYKGKYSGSAGRNYGSGRLPLNTGGGGGGKKPPGCKKSFAAGVGTFALLLLVSGTNLMYISEAALWALS